MEAVGQLAGGIAHDFNNLLTVISGYGGMARDRVGVGPGARELDQIEQAADRAAQLTHQLLAFSRQQVLEAVVLDLNEVIGAVMPMLTRLIGENVEIGVLTDEEAPPVLADRGQIEQVIVNLVVNARDAMPEGGTLTIETRQVHLDERYADEHAGVEAGTYACLSVTDTARASTARRSRASSSPSSRRRTSAPAPGSGWRPSTGSSTNRAVTSRSTRSPASARASRSTSRLRSERQSFAPSHRRAGPTS